MYSTYTSYIPTLYLRLHSTLPTPPTYQHLHHLFTYTSYLPAPTLYRHLPACTYYLPRPYTTYTSHQPNLHSTHTTPIYTTLPTFHLHLLPAYTYTLCTFYLPIPTLYHSREATSMFILKPAIHLISKTGKTARILPAAARLAAGHVTPLGVSARSSGVSHLMAIGQNGARRRWTSDGDKEVSFCKVYTVYGPTRLIERVENLRLTRQNVRTFNGSKIYKPNKNRAKQ